MLVHLQSTLTTSLIIINMTNTSSCVMILALLVVLQVSTLVLAASAKGKSGGGSTKSSGTGCKKYELFLSKLDTCNNSGVTFSDFNLTLNNDCKIVPVGCVLSKAFQTAKIKWNITSTARGVKGKDLTGEADGCKEMEKIPDNALAIMQAMKLSTSCPMNESESCATSKSRVDIKKYKDYIWMATGTTTGDINIKYDTGEACVKFEVTLRNKNGRVEKTGKQIDEAKKKLGGMLGKVVLGK